MTCPVVATEAVSYRFLQERREGLEPSKRHNGERRPWRGKREGGGDTGSPGGGGDHDGQPSPGPIPSCLLSL